ncbi:hypothetical protein VZG28_04875 [Synechococcus elongatus IITB4]|uniref:hypothetical protein n=1 Tax=Synechococcus elongatus TaxID=32046 RepID=UPI0030D0D1CD
MGLLADMYLQENNLPWEKWRGGSYLCLGLKDTLPIPVYEWAGLETRLLTVDGRDQLIDQLNDNDMPWSELADLIEAQL